MVRMIFCACFHGCRRGVVAASAVDAVARGRIGKYHQSRDWISRSANRHSGIAFGCAQCWQRRFFCRHNHFRGDDAGVISRLHALPCLAADTRKMRSTGVRSFCDLSPDRRDVHAVHARSTPRGMGLVHSRTHLGTGDLRHNYESDDGDVAPSETGAIALSRDGWLPLIVIGPLALAIPPSALFWLVAGGIAYTTGVLFFVSNRLRYAHLVWHLFVLGGTSCHFLALLGCTS